MLHILCCVTREQAQAQGDLPDLARQAAPGAVTASLLPLPEVARGPFFYRLSPHRVPSDVHPVPTDLLLTALAPVRADHVLLLDGSILLSRDDIGRLAAAVAALPPDAGLALPVRYNMCPLGAMRTVFRDGSPRFEYGVLPGELLRDILHSADAISTGDTALAEAAVRRGATLRCWTGAVQRYPERIILTRGRYGREVPGLACPPDVRIFSDFHRFFADRPAAIDARNAWREALRDAGLAMMGDDPQAPEKALRDRVWDGLAALRPDLVQLLREMPLRLAILRLMAAIEPYLDVFESRVEALSCLVMLFRQQLVRELHLGDREFWSAFSRYTGSDEMACGKLLYLKA